jgi:hypothetical protein
MNVFSRDAGSIPSMATCWGKKTFRDEPGASFKTSETGTQLKIYFFSGWRARAIESSLSWASVIAEGAEIMVSRPELFLGKAMKSRIDSTPPDALDTKIKFRRVFSSKFRVSEFSFQSFRVFSKFQRS